MDFKKFFSNMIAGLITSVLFSSVSFAMEYNKTKQVTDNVKYFKITKISSDNCDVRKDWVNKITSSYDSYVGKNQKKKFGNLFSSFNLVLKCWSCDPTDDRSLYVLYDSNNVVNAFLMTSKGEQKDIKKIEKEIGDMKTIENYQTCYIEMLAGWSPSKSGFGGGAGAILLNNVLKSKNKFFVYLADATKKPNGKCSYYEKHGFNLVKKVKSKKGYPYMYKYIDSPDDVEYYKTIESLEITELK